LEPEALQYERGDRLDLELAEAHADAGARAAAEWDVGALRQRRLALRREARRVEPVRLGEDLWQAVARPRAVVHERARGHGHARELEALDGAPRPDPRGRVHTERLVHHGLELRQPADELRRGGRRPCQLP